jgi:hypothetical protein
MTDVFGAVVHADGLGLPAPFNDVVQAANNPLCRKGEIHLELPALRRAFPKMIARNIQSGDFFD